jgi:hypothetical protein
MTQGNAPVSPAAPAAPKVAMSQAMYNQMMSMFLNNLGKAYAAFQAELSKIPMNGMIAGNARAFLDAGYCMIKEAISSLPVEAVQAATENQKVAPSPEDTQAPQASTETEPQAEAPAPVSIPDNAAA